ncbi:MAG TPA: family 16 glycosylhydrolase [Polyangiaceae bacterium]
MTRLLLSSLGFAAFTLVPDIALAVASAEVYRPAAHGYGRFEARIRFAAGDGVVSSFFLWKNGSEVSGTFWNELDFEKLGADCHVETNAIYGNPPTNRNQTATLSDPCGAYHTYAYEWTPEAIVWKVDGVEVRRETGATATAFAENAATAGMQVRFNVWPGDASFGGNFSPSILPVHQYVDWAQFSSYANGTFTMQWREDFNGTALPSGWASANWGSPKNLSTHNPQNANLIDGHLVLSLTADNALGPAGAMPGGSGGSGGAGGSSGSSAGGSSGSSAGGAAGSTSGGSSGSSSGGESGSAGTSSGGVAGSESTGGSGSGAPSGGAAGTSTTGGSAGTNGGTGPGGTAGAAAGASGGSEGDDDSDDSGGCTLSSSRSAPGSALSFVLGLVAIGALRRRFHR